MADEESVTLKSRTHSPADLASGLRTLLRTFADDSKPHRVLVAIDELDKISSTDDLIETINGLKDLFHIQGVHFIVTVSTDALRCFEQRGLVARDAFDSSFDTIIGVDSLTFEESLKILAARAQGFPPILGLFCHAWSGGLPRDLLRVARRCVEIQRHSQSNLQLTALIRAVISEDLAAVIEAELRNEDLPEDHVKYLCELRQYARMLRGSDSAAETVPALPTEFRSAVADTVSLGAALVRFFSDLVGSETTWDGWEGEAYCALQTTADLAAHAMACRTETRALRDEAFDVALRACDTPAPRHSG